MTKPMAHGPAPGNLRRNIESRPRPHRFHSPGTLEICERIIGFVTTVMSDGTTRHLHRSSPMRAVDCQRARALPFQPLGSGKYFALTFGAYSPSSRTPNL